MASVLHISAQSQAWSVTYNGSQNAADESRLLYVDGSGNSYFGAYESTSTGGNDVCILKYDNNGNRVWRASENGAMGGIDWANSLAVDGSGNIYIAGYNTDFSGTSIVIKFNSSGVYQWINYLSTAFNDEATCIATDGIYVYAAGLTFNFAHFNNDFVTTKLDCATGTTQAGWPQYYNSTYNSDDVPSSIALNSALGVVYVTGYSKHSTNSPWNQDYATIAYTTAGALVAGWPQLYDGPGSDNDVPAQILVDGSNVVITGYSTGSGTNWDICTIMYTSLGATVAGWPQRYNGAGNSYDGAGNTNSKASFRPMAVDAAGNVYVCGWTVAANGYYDMITYKYNSSGVAQAGWPKIYNGTSSLDDIGRSVALDGSGNVFVTGYTNGGGSQDFVTIKYNSSGTMQAGWPVTWDGGGSTDEALVISVVGACVWVTGNTTNSSTDMATVVYCDPLLLPIELLSFDASYNGKNNSVSLDWQTASETNNAYFLVEKSTDAVNWQAFTKVAAQGNSTRISTYHTTDDEPGTGTLYYRLKQVDMNGKYTYSQTVELNIGANNAISVYPNPNSGTSVLSLATEQLAPLNRLYVFDALGNIVLEKVITAPADNSKQLNVILDLTGSPGIYFYRLASDEKIIGEGKVVVQ
jgi:hypothetical protein